MAIIEIEGHAWVTSEEGGPPKLGIYRKVLRSDDPKPFASVQFGQENDQRVVVEFTSGQSGPQRIQVTRGSVEEIHGEWSGQRGREVMEKDKAARFDVGAMFQVWLKSDSSRQIGLTAQSRWEDE